MAQSWESVERMADLEVGDYVRLVRPHTDLRSRYPDETEEEAVVRRAEYVGFVTSVNPRGEIRLEGHRGSFLADAVFGDWFFEISRLIPDGGES